MGKRILWFSLAIFVILVGIIITASWTDPYFISRINGTEDGQVPQRTVVMYGSEGDFVVRENGSLSFTQPTFLACESANKKPFSVGELVSDSEGVLHTTEVKGYLAVKGPKLDCSFKSVDGQPVAYSVFFGRDLSGLLIVSILCLSIGSLVLMCVGGMMAFYKEK